MSTDGYSIQPLTASTWAAFADLVERHNGIFGGCWCTFFHDCAERQLGYEGSRAFKELMVEAAYGPTLPNLTEQSVREHRRGRTPSRPPVEC
jgi:hypothetical protein